MNRNMGATIAATVVVIAVVILGFREMGSPGTQRLRQADRRRVQALARIAQQVQNRWRSNKSLPADLEAFGGTDKKDPVSGRPFGYHVKSGSAYELCATFALGDNRDAAQNNNGNDSWTHPQGDYCFQLDAAQLVPNAPYY